MHSPDAGVGGWLYPGLLVEGALRVGVGDREQMSLALSAISGSLDSKML